MQSTGMDDDTPIEGKLLSRSIESAQSQLEGQNYEIRKNVLKYDDVLNRQREVVYAERRRVLEGEDLEEQVRSFMTDVTEGYVVSETAEGYAEDWDLDRLWAALKNLYPVGVTQEQLEEAAGGRTGLTSEALRTELVSDIHHAYDAREAALGEGVTRELERRVILSVLDRKWREHLYEMDYLKEGIGLRAMAQRDPLVEYQREGYNLFEAMNEAIKEEAVGFLFNAEVQVQEPEPAPLQPVAIGDMLRGLDAAPADQRQPQDAAHEAASAAARPEVHAKGLDEVVRPSRLHYSAPSEDGGVEEHDEGSAAPELSDAQLAGARRNDPCPCGSGKKFKMCHGKGA